MKPVGIILKTKDKKVQSSINLMLKDKIHKKQYSIFLKKNISKLESNNKTGNSSHARYHI
jgi:predicted nucleotide-binding protein (sugar kinase/HSP70/actin superfamily)